MISMAALWPGVAQGAGRGGGLASYVAGLPAQPVNESERDSLLFMFEEEKLARDVYTALNRTWRDRVFANIAASEQQHMDAIRALLQKYGIPVPDDTPGTYVDPRLQELFGQLTARGGKSLEEALCVGATIEDLDIMDLKEHLQQADNRDIRIVYQNLMKGSRNHLRSFDARLSALGKNYRAQFLSEDELREIISSGRERGMLNADGRPLQGVRSPGEIVRLGHGPPCTCLLYTSPSPRDRQKSRMPSSA
eukprot:TRINITY_DN2314_c0_g1_i1.p2 TRINITY_DN2314_c0_g1~~TRINITY_DN2314_c0_g1_i1.p2  ORF type:complete len:250 (+),score=93.48 TRINITY_DN2314_c0_g1_i1:849-1598(+)